MARVEFLVCLYRGEQGRGAVCAHLSFVHPWCSILNVSVVVLYFRCGCYSSITIPNTHILYKIFDRKAQAVYYGSRKKVLGGRVCTLCGGMANVPVYKFQPEVYGYGYIGGFVAPTSCA